VSDVYRDPYNRQDGRERRGEMCERSGCGKTMYFVCTLARVGAFCSERCRELVKAELHQRKAS